MIYLCGVSKAIMKVLSDESVAYKILPACNRTSCMLSEDSEVKMKYFPINIGLTSSKHSQL